MRRPHVRITFRVRVRFRVRFRIRVTIRVRIRVRAWIRIRVRVYEVPDHLGGARLSADSKFAETTLDLLLPVLIIVHEAPSLIISFLGSFGQGVD